ncbi:hypothetical protein N7486_011331 [Penicillium sp. IBT 16267x]|nr:hypothetical protein N7486_011331 [Penicillium sp. IBT 16267x]
MNQFIVAVTARPGLRRPGNAPYAILELLNELLGANRVSFSHPLIMLVTEAIPFNEVQRNGRAVTAAQLDSFIEDLLHIMAIRFLRESGIILRLSKRNHGAGCDDHGQLG